MSVSHRKVGGDNNRRGNRYEDYFVVFRLVQYAPRVVRDGVAVRLREQAGCPVDDLLLVEPGASHYHQLKADRAITWGEAGRKLERECRGQMSACEAAGIAFRLVVVVADEARRQSLAVNMPADLAGCTTVFLFPRLARPSDLAVRADLVGESLGELCAGRAAGTAEHQHVVRAFHAAWVDHEPDAGGYCVLGALISKIREWGIGRLRHDWVDRPAAWADAEAVLRSIPGLRWWVDRGYFEWEYPPADGGLSPEPCGSESFGRFTDRLVETRPSSFAQFERLLP
ncbi:MAG: hypothetical protein ACRC33_10755 [Gemmataceae bacterium]